METTLSTIQSCENNFLKQIVCACPNYAAFTNLNISLLLIIIFFSPVSVMGLIEPLVNQTLYIKFQSEKEK